MKKILFTGSGVAILTPMNADGSINYKLFEELLEDQVRAGTNAIIVCGTTGESSTMTDDEHIECIRVAVRKINGRIPVIAGTGSNDTLYSTELSVEAERLGADGVLLVSPYYNKTSQRGLVKHFSKIADAIGIPVILYNIPGRTNINISIDAFVELSKHPNINGVKEAGGDMNYFSKIIERLGDSFDVYSGDDGMTVPVMAIGGKGVISVAANIIPSAMSEICRLCFENDFKAAGKLQIKYNALFDKLLSLDVNPVPVKAAMNMMGKNVGECRLPLYTMDDSSKATLKDLLLKLEII
ncbi:MAG: 4-hydroxy-tetrahydrodipicolinate synthase [Eubacterium sp.]|jgi:4-hydroxy-tetrahydrodipicolinate synthase|nr:4-hydroxy-tetrahydrodipicolinate synthase [Eubacterium sp.]